MSYDSGSGHLFRFRSAQIFLVLGLLFSFIAQTGASAQDYDTVAEKDAGLEDDSGSTISYGPDFFALYPNAITALDIIRRIPAGASILESGAANNRGFSSNDDRILINGKRLSGKSNDSESALGRITVGKILRIDVIRGTSPDVKVSGQESILNILLVEGGDGGSGSWRASAEVYGGPQVGFGGFLSYGGSLGSFEYFVSAETDLNNRRTLQNELFFDGNEVFTNQLDEVIDRKDRESKLAGNFTYTFKGGQVLRLNGLYQDRVVKDTSSGILATPDGMGGLIFTGLSSRFEIRPRPEWEIGGDFEAALSGDLTLRIIGLHSLKDRSVSQREDFLIEGIFQVDDFIFTDVSTATETIARESLVWQVNPTNSLEFGIETAINELDVVLEFLENDGMGNLIEVFIPGSEVLIKEVRNEPFVIHSWQMNSKMNLDSALVLESFTISQVGAGVDVKRNFFFFRPSIDFRYNLTNYDQFQLSVRRRINQLNFRDFAAQASSDDEVIGANPALRPEKVWAFETSFEHRIPNDGGRLKLSLLYEIWADRIERIEVSPGVSGVGNIGTGRRFKVVVEGSVRLGFLNLPSVIVEFEAGYNPTWVTDPFTGEVRRFNNWNDHWVKVGFRHDVSSLGLSYGGEFAYYGGWVFHDLDETIENPGRTRLEFFIEKILFGTTKIRLDALDLTDADRGRVRLSFDDGVAGGILTGIERRDRSDGRRFIISLQGIF